MTLVFSHVLFWVSPGRSRFAAVPCCMPSTLRWLRLTDKRHHAFVRPPGRLRVGIMAPAHPRADILFVHGHADRLDNHGPLFAAWNAAGYRVIAFDLPSHGESNILPIDVYSFDDFFALVRLVDSATLEDPQRPLLLAAWSFGGLVATRLAQHPEQLAALSRRRSRPTYSPAATASRGCAP